MIDVHPLPDGRKAAVIDLVAGEVRVRLTNLGATLMRFETPDRQGRRASILLGHDRPCDYPAGGAPGVNHYMGASCGRYANRIGGAQFALDGRIVTLAANDGPNLLHGGPVGFDRAIWQVEDLGPRHALFSHRSDEGDQGFPGALLVKARFALSEDGELAIIYEATTDAPTHVNIVSHAYFNLSGGEERTIAEHRLRLAAAAYLPVDASFLPTGEVRPVEGTPFDFTGVRKIGEPDWSDGQIASSRGYNHNFCLEGAGLRAVAWLSHPASGRTLAFSTDQPGVQFYSGGFMESPWHPHAGLCLEMQHWPDSPNHPDFPSTRLDPGQVWRSESRIRPGLLD